MPGWTKTPADRARDAQRYGPAWRKARKAALNRAGHKCQACGSRKELSVDHVYGAANDPQHRHLQVLCGEHHRAKSAAEGAAARNGQRRSDDPPAQQRTLW